MASRSCRRKSGSSVDREEAARLLRDGAVISDPSPALIEAAKRLEKDGLVEKRVWKYVLCAEPDFKALRRKWGQGLGLDPFQRIEVSLASRSC